MLLEGFSYFLFLKCAPNVTHLGLLLFSSFLKKEVPEGNEPRKFDVFYSSSSSGQGVMIPQEGKHRNVPYGIVISKDIILTPCPEEDEE